MARVPGQDSVHYERELYLAVCWALIDTLWLNAGDNGTGTNTGFELV